MKTFFGETLKDKSEEDRCQSISDALRIFCPEAERDFREAMLGCNDERSRMLWETAFLKLFENMFRKDHALQSLTPMGSEYVNNPDLCVARARERINHSDKLVLQHFKDRKKNHADSK